MNLNIGPFAFQWAHIYALACALLATGVGRLVGSKSRVGISDVLLDMVLVAVPTGRAAFVALWFYAYQDDPWSIFDIRDGGIELWSAAVSAALMAAWRIRQRPALKRPLAAGLSAGLISWAVVLFIGVNVAPAAKGVPALTLTALDGTPAPLAPASKGRGMVVNLWATWCPPCQREMPVLARAQKNHPDIEFAFVNEGESLDVVRRYLRMVPFHLEHVLVDSGNLLSEAIDSSALPTTIIYGPDSRMAFSAQGQISEAALAMQLERCCRARR